MMRRNPFRASAAAAIAVLLLAGQACVRRSDLDARVVELAGPGAHNCGDVRSGEDSAAAMACAEDSVARGVPFRVTVEHAGIDSQLTDALIRSPDGRLTWLRLDSDISGGSIILPRPKLFEWPCAQVSFERNQASRSMRDMLFRCTKPAAQPEQEMR